MPWHDTPCDIEARVGNANARQRTGRIRTNRVESGRLKLWWSEYYGIEWPPGMYSLHHCDDVRCSNPEHIFPGTQSDNIMDCSKKGRLACNPPGEKHRMAKLTWAKVREIRNRARDGEGSTTLARQYGITQPAMSRIIRGERWKEGDSVAV